jgi:hypothetical protein
LERQRSGRPRDSQFDDSASRLSSVDYGAELEDLEREAIEEIAAVARRYVTRLPMDSRLRETLISVSDLASVFRLQRLEAEPDPVTDSPASTR